MMSWLPSLLAIAIACWLLGYSADRLVDGATSLALGLGVSTALIGVTVIAMGTSAPEIVVSAVAAHQGNTGLAIGNAIGSNIANIGLVLGAAALFAPILVRRSTIVHDLPLMLGFSALAGVLLWNGYLSRLDGVILIGVMAAFLINSIYQARKIRFDDTAPADGAHVDSQGEHSVGRAWYLTLSGLVLLVVSSRLLVWGAVNIATLFGVSDLVIGLTIVAVGTSLPELAATVAAARRNDHDMAISGIVGSHTFNLLAVLGIAGVIGPAAFDQAVLTRDFPVMISIVLMLWLIIRVDRYRGQRAIGRIAGAVLLMLFFTYMAFVGLTT